jgi:hypothetical protein
VSWLVLLRFDRGWGLATAAKFRARTLSLFQIAEARAMGNLDETSERCLRRDGAIRKWC